MDHMMRLLLVSLCTLCGGAHALGVLGEYPYVFAAVPLHAPVPVLRVLTRVPPRLRPAADPLAVASSRYGAVADPLRHFAEPPRPYATEPPRQYAAAAVDPLRHYAEPPRPYAVVGAPLRHLTEPPTRHLGGTTRHYAAAAAAEPDAEYETPQYSYARPSYHPPPRPEYPAAEEEVVLYAQGQRGEASGEAGAGAGAVLYARLSPTGGYTYRRAPARAAAAASDHHLRKAVAVPAPAPIKNKDPQYILKIHKYRIIRD